MAEVLLTREDFIKKVSNISDNLAGKFMLSSMREAQDVGLKNIIGSALLHKVKTLVGNKTIHNPDNSMYKALVDECQYYLAYMTIVEITNKVSYKIANAGVTKTSDENTQNASQDEIVKQQYYYQAKADFYCKNLQNWILENKSSFPELTECQCRKIHATLYSAATCGVFLGGARGKRVRR